jgi:hypothetical protein
MLGALISSAVRWCVWGMWVTFGREPVALHERCEVP